MRDKDIEEKFLAIFFVLSHKEEVKEIKKNNEKEIQVEVIYTCTPEELSRRYTEICLEVLMQRKTLVA